MDLYPARGKVVIYYKYAKNTEVITFGNGEVNPPTSAFHHHPNSPNSQ